MNIQTNQKSYNIIIFAFIVLLIIVRHIDFFVYPRFWAEEGDVYFLDAYTNGFSALWHAHVGYYSIIPNFSTYFATYMPLEFAPVLTLCVSFIVQIIPFYLIFISQSKYYDSSLKKLVASLIILLVGHTGEIWLNTITSQFHFVVILFLILIDNKTSMSMLKKNLYFLLVLIGGLSGIPANILAPFFVLKYLHTKEKSNLYFFGILVFTTLVQIIFILSIDGPDRFTTSLSSYETMQLVLRVLLNVFVYPVTQATRMHLIILVIPIVYLVFLAIKGNKDYGIFFYSSFLLSIIMVLASLGMTSGERYMYAPSVIFILGFQAIVFGGELEGWKKKAVLILTIISLGRGLAHYPMKDGFVDSENWKRWKDEALLYEKRTLETIKIYPQWKDNTWTVKLPRK